MAAAVKAILSRNGLPEIAGGAYVCVMNYTFSSAYTTNGESLTPADFKFPPEATMLYVGATSASGQTFRYDYTAKKLVAVVATTGVEVANGIDLSAVTTRIHAIAE